MAVSLDRIRSLLDIALPAVLQAGDAILAVYDSPFAVEHKEDRSPITLADRRSHDTLTAALASEGLPVLSEEGRDIPHEERKGWELFWLIDPLDGTKEFVKRNGEFTVNIALVEGKKTIAGIIHVPVKDQLYLGAKGLGAFRFDETSALRDVVKSGRFSWERVAAFASILPLTQPVRDKTVVVASRSHLTPETREFIDKCGEKFGETEQVSRGSSLKLCLIAEGAADLYPRLAPTMAWDIAAGHAIVEAAGGSVKQINGLCLEYNNESLTNPWFVAQRSGFFQNE